MGDKDGKDKVMKEFKKLLLQALDDEAIRIAMRQIIQIEEKPKIDLFFKSTIMPAIKGNSIEDKMHISLRY